MHPTRFLFSHHVPNYKWQVISIDFIQGVPMFTHKNDIILVVVDKMTKVAHFIPSNLKDGSVTLA